MNRLRLFRLLPFVLAMLLAGQLALGTFHQSTIEILADLAIVADVEGQAFDDDDDKSLAVVALVLPDAPVLSLFTVEETASKRGASFAAQDVHATGPPVFSF